MVYYSTYYTSSDQVYLQGALSQQSNLKEMYICSWNFTGNTGKQSCSCKIIMIIEESPANTIFYCSLNEPSGILWRAKKVLLFRSLNRSRCVKLCLFCEFNLRFEFKGPVASLLYILSFLYVAQSHEDSFSCDVSGELSTSYREKLSRADRADTISLCSFRPFCQRLYNPIASK